MKNLVQLNVPSNKGENDDVRAACIMILDEWRLFTPKQVGIAATVAGYFKPAETVSRAQLWNLKQAQAAYMQREDSAEPGDLEV